MSVFDAREFDDHERLVFCRDAASGLKAIIAIHNTTLGPAAGGCRMWSYRSEGAAVRDVLRLSRGMSFKNALADLPLGGGKAVVIGDPRRHKSEALLRAFGDAVERLGGVYVTAEDVGMSMADMEIIARRTAHVSGLPTRAGRAGGDPSPKTAYGVYLGILAAVGFQTDEPDRDRLDGIRVAVQGLGAVGSHLCRYLHEAGAELLVSDIDTQRVEAVCREYAATALSVHQVISAEADVLAPCALGGILNTRSVRHIQASIVAGAANNQLADDGAGVALAERGTLYAPDYVINAGGIINVAYEHLGLGDESAVLTQIRAIGPRLWSIFEQARAQNLSTHRVADDIARQRLRRRGKLLRSAA